MKRIINIFLMLLIASFVISCENHSADEHEHSATEETAENHHGDGNVLSLNNGELWTANHETTFGINSMISLMDSFSEKESVDAYTILKNKLEEEFNMIFQKCTMTGESHNQLHNYLQPMTEMFDGIGSSDLNVCQTNFDKLNKHLAEYSNFFK